MRNSVEEIYLYLGRTIRSRRKKIGITQEALAERIGLKRTSVTNIEKGRQKIQLHTLYEIAFALDIAPQILLPVLAVNDDAITERVKGLQPDEQAFVRSVLVAKTSD